MNLKVIALLLMVSCITPKAITCSAFQLKTDDNSFVGKSYDWRFGDGYLVFNPSQLIKVSHSLNPFQKLLKWKSIYPSLTYNQYGLEFPNGGINSTGLTVEVLWLDSSVYPSEDGKKSVLNELQWIQYILDTQSTVMGAVRTLEKVQVKPIYAKVHYFICDRRKDCATVEYINGIAKTGTYERYQLEAITNSTHEESTRYLSQFKNFGGNNDIVWDGYRSLDRFARVNEQLRVYNGEAPVPYAFGILDSVKRDQFQGTTYTAWQIVYDVTQLDSYIKTVGDNAIEGKVSLKQFKDNCKVRQYLNLNSKLLNGKLRFKPFTKKANYSLVSTSLRKVMPNAPESLVKEISDVPFSYRCAN